MSRRVRWILTRASIGAFTSGLHFVPLVVPLVGLRVVLRVILLVALLGGFGLALPAAAETPRHPDELQVPAIEFTPSSAQTATLPCGIPVILYPNHDLPILDLTIRFRMGTRFLPAEEHTACGILSDLWRDGGTERLSPDSLDSVLIGLDATVTTFVGHRTGGVNVSLSTEDLEQALPIWRDVVTRPAFDADRLVRSRVNRLQQLQNINNDPGSIADERFSWLLMGRDYPTSRMETRADIDAVAADELRELHRRYVRPENALIGVSGDFDPAKMLALLDRLFRDWPVHGSFTAPVLAPWTPQTEPGVYVLRGDYEQSQVRLGRLISDLTDTSPDYAASTILSFGLGYERVFYRVRAEGLTYGAAVRLGVGDEYSTLRGFGSCRGDATVPLLRAMLEETARVAVEPIEGQDLEAARVFMIGGEVRANETAAAIMQQKVGDRLQDRPENYRTDLLQRLKTATREDMQRLAREYVVRDDPWVLLVLGNPEDFATPLDSLGLGPVRELAPVVFGE
jgi:zinc protease